MPPRVECKPRWHERSAVCRQLQSLPQAMSPQPLPSCNNSDPSDSALCTASIRRNGIQATTQHSGHTTQWAHNTVDTQHSGHNTADTQHSGHTTQWTHNTAGTQHSGHNTVGTQHSGHTAQWAHNTAQKIQARRSTAACQYLQTGPGKMPVSPHTTSRSN